MITSEVSIVIVHVVLKTHYGQYFFFVKQSREYYNNKNNSKRMQDN